MRKRLAVLIIVLCLVLIACAISAILLYNREVVSDSNSHVSDTASDKTLSSDQLAISDTEQYMKDNSEDIIKYDKSDSSAINLPKSVSESIEHLCTTLVQVIITLGT